ncbi:MAG TPA: SH3 domain-containing protein, partial [Phototrophicaceae bacterium]|nr:SH3 domain-containing protein [Phototrophicaceae bacterium]
MSGSPSPVPKPSNAGTGQTALARTAGAFVNLRSGPGSNYQDIGDIRNNTVLVYYSATRTNGDWVWIEQFNTSGWVSTSVISFENISAPKPIPPDQATPYDNKVGIWHWKGDSLTESTIEEVARNLKATAPNVTQLWVKISDATARDGAQWMGYWDTKRNLAIDGPQSIDRWVQVLQSYGLEFHAWAVPKGSHVEAETNIIIQACSRPGVKSLILDMEPYDGFWQGGQAGIRPYMTRIRRGLPASFHIGLAVDPRRQHYANTFPQEWYPFVNSVHPMAYWATFRRTPEDVLKETFEVWGNYGRPIIPILDGDAQASEMSTATTLAVQRHQARGLSWWRLGIISSTAWSVINQPGFPGQPTTPPVDTGTGYGDEIIIRPNTAGFDKGSYTGKDELSKFQGTWGWEVLYKGTEPQTSKVWTRWTPTLRQSGKYEIATFIPSYHG